MVGLRAGVPNIPPDVHRCRGIILHINLAVLLQMCLHWPDLHAGTKQVGLASLDPFQSKCHRRQEGAVEEVAN